MDRIQHVFSKPGRKALIAYITVGYPTLERTVEAVPLLASLGCDIIELGIPFSDPLADGATIQEASFLALKNGTTVRACLDVARRIRQKTDVALAFMTYYNPVLAFGPARFCRSCSEIGVDGLIIPDLPPEENGELQASVAQAGMDLIYLLSPNSSEERISLVARQSQGFIYLVSLTGVTGARRTLPPDLEEFVSRVRRMTDKPLCVGFGISTAEEAGRVASVADGVIVGSRIVQLLGGQSSLALADFVRGLRSALDSQGASV